MTYVQKARLTFLGIDDELKNDATSVYITNINSSFFSVPAVLNVGTGQGVAPTLVRVLHQLTKINSME